MFLLKSLYQYLVVNSIILNSRTVPECVLGSLLLSVIHFCITSLMNILSKENAVSHWNTLKHRECFPLFAEKFISFTFFLNDTAVPWFSFKAEYKEVKCAAFTCSSDSWEMWFTAAYDSILGLKWLIMALKDKNTCAENELKWSSQRFPQHSKSVQWILQTLYDCYTHLITLLTGIWSHMRHFIG